MTQDLEKQMEFDFRDKETSKPTGKKSRIVGKTVKTLLVAGALTAVAAGAKFGYEIVNSIPTGPYPAITIFKTSDDYENKEEWEKAREKAQDKLVKTVIGAWIETYHPNLKKDDTPNPKNKNQDDTHKSDYNNQEPLNKPENNNQKDTP